MNVACELTLNPHRPTDSPLVRSSNSIFGQVGQVGEVGHVGQPLSKFEQASNFIRCPSSRKCISYIYTPSHTRQSFGVNYSCWKLSSKAPTNVQILVQGGIREGQPTKTTPLGSDRRRKQHHPLDSGDGDRHY